MTNQSRSSVVTPKLKVLDLFSGIGGFSLGLERTGGFETVAFCEIDPFCQKVLRKHWPDVPIYEDVRTLEHDGPVDVITGGYPCQPFSLAGKRKGEEDDRHLWPAMFALIKRHRPAWVLGENVAGHVSLGLDAVLADLEKIDYACRPYIIPACAVDAPHRRDRIWIVANAKHPKRRAGEPDRYEPNRETAEWQETPSGPGTPGENGHSGAMADANCNQQHGRCRVVQVGRQRLSGKTETDGFQRGIEWSPEPGVGRVAHGIPRRVDRLRSLGNTVVPQIPEAIGYAILSAADKNSC